MSSGHHGGADMDMLDHWMRTLKSGEYDETNPVGGRQSVAVGCLGAESLRGANDWKAIPPLPYKT